MIDMLRRFIAKKISIFTEYVNDIHQFSKHLENQFTEGMSWDNVGKWHIVQKTPQINLFC